MIFVELKTALNVQISGEGPLISTVLIIIYTLFERNRAAIRRPSGHWGKGPRTSTRLCNQYKPY